jgi:hypothetical protein
MVAVLSVCWCVLERVLRAWWGRMGMLAWGGREEGGWGFGGAWGVNWGFGVVDLVWLVCEGFGGLVWRVISYVGYRRGLS